MRDIAVKRAIIFDLDGTLVDSCKTCVSILQDIIGERGIDHQIDHAFARPLMSRGGAQMVATLLGPAAKDTETDLEEFRARYASTTTCVSALYPGVREGIAGLAAHGLALAICSNKPQNLCDKVLQDTGLAEYFPVVIGSRVGVSPKPAPDLLELTLAALQLPSSHCVFVGDSELDHQVAVAAAMPFFYLSHGYAEPGWQPRDSLTFDAFDELCQSLADHHQAPFEMPTFSQQCATGVKL